MSTPTAVIEAAEPEETHVEEVVRDASSAALEDVIQHLLFHKAIIDDAPAVAHGRMNRYIDIARQMQDGSVSAYNDPFDRAVATVFELVSKNEMDPWDIDLGEFARIYTKRITEAGGVDFVVAGRILFLAWSVLKMQTSRSVVKFRPEPESMGDLGLDAGDIGQGYDEAAFSPDAFTLEPVIRRSPERPVTLIDLVDAFDEVRREIELRQILNAGRIDAVKELPKFQDRVHGENLEEGITVTWQRILARHEEWIPLGAIRGADREEFVTTFIAVLFLTKLGKLDVKQEGPAWKIRVPSMVPGFRAELLAKYRAAKKATQSAETVSAPTAASASAPKMEADGGSELEDVESALGEVYIRNIAGSVGDVAAEARVEAEAVKASQRPAPRTKKAQANGKDHAHEKKPRRTAKLSKRKSEQPDVAASPIETDPVVGDESEAEEGNESESEDQK